MVEKLYDVYEASRALRLSVPTLRTWIHTGRLRPVRLGKRVLFTEAMIQSIIDAGKPNGQEGRTTHA